MPSSPAGDSGNDGVEDDDLFDEEVAFRPPLPPEDRLWRHPSEVAAAARARALPPAPPRSRWRTGVKAGLGTTLVGATLTVAVLMAAGGFRSPVVERESVPAVALGNDQLSTIAARAMPSVVGVTAAAGTGSSEGNAVVIDDGYLLTTASLIGDVEQITIHTHDGRSEPAHLIGADETTDLALLYAPTASLPPAEIGSVDAVGIGDETFLLGWTLESDWSPAASVGIVTATGSRFANDANTYHGMVLIDTDGHVNSPGSPLFNEHGALIGLTNGYTTNGLDSSIAAATPMDVAVRVSHQLIESGRATDAWLGVGGSDLDVGSAQSLGVEGGAQVSNVRPDSPAASAGLHDGDVILDVDGERIYSMSDLIGKLRERQPGDEIVITVLRDDTVQDIATTLSERVDIGDVPATPTPPVGTPTDPGGSAPSDPASPTPPTSTTTPPTTGAPAPPSASPPTVPDITTPTGP